MGKIRYIVYTAILICCIAILSLVSWSIKTEDDGTTRSGELEFEIIKVDGCQYITTVVLDDRLFTHKGDCNNPIHAPIVMYSDTTLAEEFNSHNQK